MPLRVRTIPTSAGDKDKTGRAALERVVGESLEDFEPKWRAWVIALQGDNR